MRGGEGDEEEEEEEEEEGAGKLEVEVEVEDCEAIFRLFLLAGVPVLLLLPCLAPKLALRPLADTPGGLMSLTPTPAPVPGPPPVEALWILEGCRG